MTDASNDPRLSAADETLSPVDLPGSALIGGRPLAWTSATIAVAALFLLLFNAQAIRDWTVELTPGSAQERLADAAEGWLAFTTWMGTATPRATLHGLWKQAQAARFGTERPGA